MKDENLLFKSLWEIADVLKNKQVSVLEIVEGLLDRIDSLDQHLNSFITINPDALELAKKADREINAGNYKGPLHGIPIGLKDMIYTSDMKTTMGSPIYKNHVPQNNANVVMQLKNAGAILIGKLNTHQFAYGPTGDRSYYGPVSNPYDLNKMSGGSSSGSAAAVAACFAYGSIGTDTSGSIRIPASFCGIVGMKPTKGAIASCGVYPLSWTLDHVGPMTRRVHDNAILMNTLQCDDKVGTVAKEDYTRLIGKDVTGYRLGVPSQYYLDDLDSEIEGVFRKNLSLLEQLGVEIVNVDLSGMEDYAEVQKIILRSEAYVVHKNNLSEYPDMWDDEVKDRLNTALDDKGYEYAKALRMQQSSKQVFDHALEHVDALVTPTVPIMPPKINERYTGVDKSDANHIRWSILRLTAPTNLNGLPSLTLPCGFSSDGMPIGIQLIGRAFDEAKLYQLGYALEQKLGIDTSRVNLF